MMRPSSERSPLSAVPSIELSENGEILTMGRSSNSSHFQLSANRLISRVHVQARYIAAASPLEPNKIEIICNGWNGLKLHCQGRTWELFKGDSFTSETEGTEVMVDVQDARVMLQWPRRDGSADAAALSDSTWDDSPPRSQTRAANLLASSPLRRPARIESPESPTPGHLASSRRLQALLPTSADGDSGIEIYEDEPEDDSLAGEDGVVNPAISMQTDATASFASSLSELDENDPDEENDPIIHSFGPFGADITARMASIIAKSPRAGKLDRRPQPITLDVLPEDDSAPPSPSTETKSAKANVAKSELEQSTSKETTPTPFVGYQVDTEVTNHVINQLAFSRLSSTPLSTIMQNLPAEQKKDLPREALRRAIEATDCVGIIKRQGKDAAGKALESEYYYVPDNDDDEQRKAAVVGLRKPSLRACRKQHKQYYWKRPKTP